MIKKIFFVKGFNTLWFENLNQIFDLLPFELQEVKDECAKAEAESKLQIKRLLFSKVPHSGPLGMIPEEALNADETSLAYDIGYFMFPVWMLKIPI